MRGANRDYLQRPSAGTNMRKLRNMAKQSKARGTCYKSNQWIGPQLQLSRSHITQASRIKKGKAEKHYQIDTKEANGSEAHPNLIES